MVLNLTRPWYMAPLYVDQHFQHSCQHFASIPVRFQLKIFLRQLKQSGQNLAPLTFTERGRLAGTAGSGGATSCGKTEIQLQLFAGTGGSYPQLTGYFHPAGFKRYYNIT